MTASVTWLRHDDSPGAEARLLCRTLAAILARHENRPAAVGLPQRQRTMWAAGPTSHRPIVGVVLAEYVPDGDFSVDNIESLTEEFT